MSSYQFFRSLVLLGVGAAAAVGSLRGQSDLNSPKQREQVVADAVRIARERNTAPALPTPLPNPFVPKEVERKDDPVAPAPVEPTATGADLLALLAARIPSTGTVTIGGDPILLLGQKRLKVGDTITISFEGQTYELSIAAVTSTSFTVKRGENIHTRPVRISASTNSPTNRP